MYRIHEDPVLAGKIVYTVHHYHWSWGDVSSVPYDQWRQQMDNSWGFIVVHNMAPIFLGELGLSVNGMGYFDWMDRPLGEFGWFPEQARYIMFLSRYVIERRLHYAYWTMDGQKEQEVGAHHEPVREDFGLFLPDYSGLKEHASTIFDFLRGGRSLELWRRDQWKAVRGGAKLWL